MGADACASRGESSLPPKRAVDGLAPSSDTHDGAELDEGWNDRRGERPHRCLDRAQRFHTPRARRAERAAAAGFDGMEAQPPKCGSPSRGSRSPRCLAPAPERDRGESATEIAPNAKAPQDGGGKDDRVVVALIELAQPCVHVARIGVKRLGKGERDADTADASLPTRATGQERYTI